MSVEINPQRSICQFCHTNCGILIHRTEYGKFSVQGDPEHPVNRGVCCSKAAAIPEILEGKNRLRHPALKTSNGFKQISWEEALVVAADKLGEIRSKHGPNALVRCGGAPVSYQCRDGFLEFMGAFGSSNMTGAGNLCMVPRMTAFNAVTGYRRPEPDYDSAKLVLVWGANPSASERYSAYAAYNGMRRIFSRLRDRGTRIICIDPYRTKTAAQADDWIRINPGSDVALGLAMIQVIIEEGLFDRVFVDGYTLGFEALEDHIKSFNPVWAATITGVNAETIRELARTYATIKPAAVFEGNGLDMYTNGVDGVRTIAILIGLTGNLDVPGGNVLMPFVLQATLPTHPANRETRLGYEKFPLFPEVPFPAVKESLLRRDDDRPRAMIVHHSNPVLVQANERRTIQALKKLDFLIVNEIYPTATSEIADLVLPVTSDFEDYGYRAYADIEGGFLAMARPVTDPPGLARSVFEVEYELAERLDLHHTYPFHDAKSWLSFMIRPSGITFERLEAEQIVRATPPIRYHKYEKKGFDTPSGKVELFSKSFEEQGCGTFPEYQEPAGEPLNHTDLAEAGFPLLGSTMRPAQFVHTKFRDIGALTKSYPEPLIRIHPKDARARGIEDGETVKVSSPQGTVEVTSRLTDDTRPGLIWIDFGWGNPSDGKAGMNRLTNDRYLDPISGGTPNRIFPCEVISRKQGNRGQT